VPNLSDQQIALLSKLLTWRNLRVLNNESSSVFIAVNGDDIQVVGPTPGPDINGWPISDLKVLEDESIVRLQTINARAFRVETMESAQNVLQSISPTPLANGSVADENHRVFGNIPPEVDEKQCFVLMPFAEDFKELWEDVIRPTIIGLGLRCIRADDLYGSRPIIQDVWENIARARVLIADLTGRNANVFYELGIAHQMGKDVILLAQIYARFLLI
jgi:hypothetical protein